ncbi:hypothetical protein N9W34_04595 [Rickettsiales bacterium]|nr:hypothetical protein [Rickettsiales bacterium]
MDNKKPSGWRKVWHFKGNRTQNPHPTFLYYNIPDRVYGSPGGKYFLSLAFNIETNFTREPQVTVTTLLYKTIDFNQIGIHTRLDGGGYRLTFPSKKSGQQQFQIFHPIRKDVGAAIERAIFDKLKDVMSKTNDRYDCVNPEPTAI